MPYHPKIPAGCPPADAVAGSHIIYRIAKKNPIDSGDLATYFELGKKGPACEIFGLSCYPNRLAAVHQAQLAPMIGKHILKGVLQATHGPLKQTFKPPHMTWWPIEGLDRCSIFEYDGDVG